jgi:hypothetical protein
VAILTICGPLAGSLPMIVGKILCRNCSPSVDYAVEQAFPTEVQIGRGEEQRSAGKAHIEQNLIIKRVG